MSGGYRVAGGRAGGQQPDLGPAAVCEDTPHVGWIRGNRSGKSRGNTANVCRLLIGSIPG